MKKVYQNTYYDFSVEDDCNCIIFEWKNETQSMKDDDFKEGLYNFAKYGQENHCHEMCVDLRNFKGHPSPEVAQTWRSQEAVPRYNKMGIKKFAYLKNPGDPGPNMSEPHKNDGEEFETAVFESEEAMWHWLKK